MNAVKYTEESRKMRLHDAVEYFSLSVTVVFLVIEGAYNSKEREAVAKGDIFIACLKKTASLLKLKSGSACVTVPVVTRTEFALTPLSEEDNEADAAIRSWEGVYQSVTEFFKARRDQSTPMPAVLKVLKDTVNHSRKKVDLDPSLQYPPSQPNGWAPEEAAMVYLHTDMEQEEDEGVRSLQNLSTHTITEVSHGHHLVVRKLSDDGNQLGPTFTVPLSADLKVVAVKLKDSQLLDRISGQRCVNKCKPEVKPSSSESCEKKMHQVATMERRLLPLTPKEECALAVTYSDKERLYDEPQKVLDRKGQTSTYSTPPTVNELTKVEENTGLPSILETTMPESNADTSTDDYGYTKVGPPQAGHESDHKVSDVEAEQAGPESEQGFPVSTTTVQCSPLVRCNTAPPHQSHSSSPRRRHTICLPPKEPELRFHVAAKLGQDWRKVCTYLGLQHYQLEQADVAHAQLLEEKAMEALVMWLQGQGDSEAPRSWETLVDALHWARRNDIANDVKMGIKNGTLTVAAPNYK